MIKNENGISQGLYSYRSPDEIKADIREIRERIDSVNDLFNIRELIASVITEGAGDDICRVAEAAAELADAAEEAMLELRVLNESLSELREELLFALREGG